MTNQRKTPKTKLNVTERKVRSILVRENGRKITQQKIADELGVSRFTVFSALQAIRRFYPLPMESEFIEKAEIERAIGWYDDLIQTLSEELELNDAQTKDNAESPYIIGFLNARLGLLNQLRQAQQDRESFLMKIGLVQRAPDELILRKKRVGEMSSDEVAEEIAVLKSKRKELEDGGPPGDAGGGEGAVPCQPGPDDTIQGS